MINPNPIKKSKNMNRQKLLEAIIFFSQKGKIKNPSKMMMYKLIAEIDFRHFEETGLPITDLNYEAFPWGPVPTSYHNEITKGDKLILPKDFEKELIVEQTEFEDESGRKYIGFKYIALRKPNLSIFSPRQHRIMVEVAEIYKNATATEASKASHEPGKPWTITVERKGVGAVIDLIETIKLNQPFTKEKAKEYMKERKAMIYNYGG